MTPKKTSRQMLNDARELLEHGHVNESIAQARKAISKSERTRDARRNEVIQLGVQAAESFSKRPREKDTFIRRINKESLGRKYNLKSTNEKDILRLVLEDLFATQTENQRRKVSRYIQILMVLKDLKTPSESIAAAIKENGGINALEKVWHERHGSSNSLKKAKRNKLSITLGGERFDYKDSELEAGIAGVKARGRVVLRYKKTDKGYAVIGRPTIEAM